MGAWMPMRILVSLTPVRSAAPAGAGPPGTGAGVAVPPPAEPEDGPAADVGVRPPVALPVPAAAPCEPPEAAEPALFRADGEPEPVAGVEVAPPVEAPPVDPAAGAAGLDPPLVSAGPPPPPPQFAMAAGGAGNPRAFLPRARPPSGSAPGRCPPAADR